MTDYVTPAEQAMNLIRYIGDECKENGTAPLISHILKSLTLWGLKTMNWQKELLKNYRKRRLILIAQHESDGRPMNITLEGVTLSLDGWEQYEEEQRGKFAGNYGFLAMEFDDPEHETFAQEVLKPAVERGYRFRAPRSKG